MRCPQCGASVAHGSKSCPVCGADLGAAGIHGGPSPSVETRTTEYDPADDEVAVGRSPAARWRVKTLRHDVLAKETRPRRSRKAKHSEDAPLDRHQRPRKHRRVWYWAIITALVGVVVAGAAVAIGSYELELWGGRTVPAVVGHTLVRATQEMEEKGFRVESVAQPSDSGDGYVLSTQPGAGERVDEESVVTLVVSANRVIPSVRGLALEAAREALESQGAQNIRVVYDSSTEEPESTVLDVSPSEGAVFMSSDEVTLTVAQAPAVPDVVGKSEEEAMKALGETNLTGEVTYVGGSESQRGMVVSTQPEAGARAGDDGVVRLNVVSPNPTDFRHLLEYFSCTTNALPAWLEDQGFVLRVGYKAGSDRAFEALEDGSGDTVSFSSTPWLRLTQREGTAPEDVLTTGAFYDGLRLELSEGQCPETGATQVSASTVASACGFGEATDSCSQTSITVPDGTGAPKTAFYCLSGESDEYVWTVLVRSTSGSKVEAVCTAAPKELYEAQDLSTYGDSVCDFVAFEDMYGNATASTQAEEAKEPSDG